MNPYTYDHIPQLEELLTTNGGLPGVQYAQVHVSNLTKARDEGWNRIHNAQTYTIVGPTGHADCELLARGKPISGQSSSSGRRVCYVDDSVYKLTGFENPKGPAETAVAATPKPVKPKPTVSADPSLPAAPVS